MRTALHPQAKFDPIPPDIDVEALVDGTPNFQFVQRISAAQIRSITTQQFEKLVTLHVIEGGKPLVIEKWNSRLPKSLFGAEWLERNYDKKQENVRDIVNQTDIPMTTGHYLRSMKQLTNQWTRTNFRDERRQRLYLKDIDCPSEWRDHLQNIIPPYLWYMNENIEEQSGNRRLDEFDMYQEPSAVAPAGDLMSSLPEEMRAQNLMCYIGHEGTYTPAHREMCASLGQNIMVDTSGEENGEKPGSSIWFMTETKDREVVREYFLSMLGHDVEIEKHFAQVNAWKKATFPVYIVEQKVGDFILVPPLAPHQVWNRGTRTMKVAWNRTTVETLRMALDEALPKARIVCRDEQYKNKAIVYYTLKKYYKMMQDAEQIASDGFLGFGQDLMRNSSRMKQVSEDFKALFALFTDVLLDEVFASKEDVEYIEFDSCVTCSYCRANIFNRFLTCKHCVRPLIDGSEDTYDVCMECYAMGRSCLCVADLSWCEQWEWSELVENHEDWRALVIKNEGFINLDLSPLPLELARKKFGKKSLAQICQDQLRRRPFNDINKVNEPAGVEEAEEAEIHAHGRSTKKKRKARKRKVGDVHRCHVCQHKEYTYKLAFCSNAGCADAYCYGVLYRAFDEMPQDVMKNVNWTCPKCRNMCSCATCRRANTGTPYIPKNTLLGHDTRAVADDRSVETLVDFRLHNLSWLINTGDESRNVSSKRMEKLRKAAELEKAKEAASLEEEVLALPDGDTTERPQETPADEAPHIDGDGDQGGDMRPAAATGNHLQVSAESEQYQAAGPAEIVEMSIVEDRSSYPDPTVLGQERMLGMGYYQQDDSPDRILFDPYLMPLPDAVTIDDEPEMSEYFMKQLRVAKRRARHEEDLDPDFAAPKSHPRKRPRRDGTQRDAQQEALNNMDPALFINSIIDTSAHEDRTVEAEMRGPMPQQMDRSFQLEAQAEDLNNHEPYAPNVPCLRPARPKVSYVEQEAGENEYGEIIVPRPQRPPPGIADTSSEKASKDPLDLASAAIYAITAGTGIQATKAAPTAEKQKRRGRPPGRPRRSGRPSVAKPVAKSSGPRPRSTRSSLAAAAPTEGGEDSDDDSAALAADQNPKGVVDVGTNAPAPVPKRRRRPPKQDSPLLSITVAVDIPSSDPFLSIADRLRLKGKKVKITQRSPGTRKPEEQTRDSGPLGVSKDDLPSMADPGPNKTSVKGPRAVEAHESAKDDGRQPNVLTAASESHGYESPDDEVDIPVRFESSARMATRGGRGRGSKRGRERAGSFRDRGRPMGRPTQY